MKAKFTSLFSGSWPDGALLAPIPGEVVEVDDADADRVAYLRRLADEGQAEVLEDAKQPASTEAATEPATPAEPSLAELRDQAAAKGLPTYGTKAELRERLAEAGK